MMKIESLVIALSIIALLPGAGVSSGYHCEGKIISVGDTSGELIMKCGEPDWKQSYTEEIIETLDKDNKRNIHITVEEWTYNLGPQRFMRIFKLKNGKVVDMWLGDYGYAEEGINQFQCGAQSVSVGDSAAEVVAKCGEPAWKDEREEIIREQLDDDTVRKVYITVEDWTYNFGPNQFLRVFTFRNGKVTDIRTGEYGYEVKPKEEKP
jgi:hypothetical protein